MSGSFQCLRLPAPPFLVLEVVPEVFQSAIGLNSQPLCGLCPRYLLHFLFQMLKDDSRGEELLIVDHFTIPLV